MVGVVGSRHYGVIIEYIAFVEETIDCLVLRFGADRSWSYKWISGVVTQQQRILFISELWVTQEESTFGALLFELLSQVVIYVPHSSDRQVVMVNNYRRKGSSWFLSNVCFNWLLICLTSDCDWFILFYFDSFELLEDDSNQIN